MNQAFVFDYTRILYRSSGGWLDHFGLEFGTGTVMDIPPGERQQSHQRRFVQIFS